MIGTQLGPYKILEQLGAGGMGEVWLAEDTRLDRKVAVKVLPAEFASDPERLARFEQEAKAAAALNHPNIAAVFDVGTEGEGEGATHYMVQEFLEGETLRARIDKGALPLDKALAVAGEIAEALAAAHKAGIVHRDLKPDNIFLIEGDHAKVLDFGLAKLMEVAPPSASSASMSPTLLGTVAGQVMGTAGYMAPEQVNGEEVDARADVFGFGCVLYEMVSGRRAFQGKNIHDTLGLIISDAPAPVAKDRADLPLKLTWLVDKALAKDPARRYQSAAGVNADLQQLRDDLKSGEALGAGVVAAESGAGAATRGGPAGRAMFVVVLAVVAVVAVYAGRAMVEPGGLTETMRVSVALDPATDFLGGDDIDHPPFALAPDGSGVVFAAAIDEQDPRAGTQLYRRLFDETEATPIPGTEGAQWPFFSPNGERIGFGSVADELGVEWDIVSVPATGGPRTVHVGLVNPRGLHWGTDEYIYYTTSYRSGVRRIAADRGESEVVTELAAPEVTHRHARLIPDTRTMLYTAADGYQCDWDTARVMAHDLETGDSWVVVDGGADARVLPSGHLVWSEGNWIMAAAFDRTEARLLGDPVPVVADVLASQCLSNPARTFGTLAIDVAANGTLAYLRGQIVRGRGRVLRIYSPSDEEPTILDIGARPCLAPRVSPDGSLVTVGTSRGVAILDVDRPEAVNFVGEESCWSTFTQSTNEVIYKNGASSSLVRSLTDGTGLPEVLYTDLMEWYPAGVAPDGKVLIGRAEETDETSAGWGIYWIDEDGERNRLFDRGVQRSPAFSPDGRWLAYTEGLRGEKIVIITSYPELEGRYVVGPGHAAVWSPEGDELWVRVLASDRVNRGFVSVDVSDPTAPGEAERAGPARGWYANPVRNFDSLPDGRVVITGEVPGDPEANSDPSRSDRIELVLNWFTELERLVPTDGSR